MDPKLTAALVALAMAAEKLLNAITAKVITSKNMLILVAAAYPVLPRAYALAADPVVRTYYAPDVRITEAAVGLVNSSTGAINVASNAFSDQSLISALCLAASRGVAVSAVLDVTTGTAASIPYRQLTTSGGSVWIANFPNRIENHVFTIDGGTCGTGNYVWSGSAVQAGAWWAIVTGTATTSGFNTTFGSLQASGTRQMSLDDSRRQRYDDRMELVLSLFPGIDLLGRAFEAEGFAVVRGPDLIVGTTIETFHMPAGRVTGIIAGPPCQDFSKARRTKPSGHGEHMLVELLRVVHEARPEWFLVENVPGVPNIRHPMYHHQRLDITDCSAGGTQLRRRHIQFCSQLGHIIRPERCATRRARHTAVMATEVTAGTLTYAELCRRQGLDSPIRLPGWSRAAKIRAVGNGVPIAIGRALATAVAARSLPRCDTDCACGCGRPIAGKQAAATAACRKRIERAKRSTATEIAWSVTPTRVTMNV